MRLLDHVLVTQMRIFHDQPLFQAVQQALDQASASCHETVQSPVAASGVGSQGLDRAPCAIGSVVPWREAIPSQLNDFIHIVFQDNFFVGYVYMLRSLDLFSGIGGITHALRGLAKPVMYCEKDPDARRVVDVLIKRGRLPAAPVADDVRKLTAVTLKNKVDIIVAGFPCFVEGTLVETLDGYKRIEDVTHDDMVLTHTGAWHSVENTQRTWLPAGTPLVHVGIKHHFCDVQTTEDHPFFARVPGQDPTFVSAKDLTDSHYVGMPIDSRAVETSGDFGVSVVPDEIHAAPLDRVRHFVEGFTSDGNLATTGSVDLALGLQRLYAKLGVVAGLVVSNGVYTVHDTRASDGYVADGYVWHRVDRVDVQAISEPRMVYNVQVAHDNSYCVFNTGVHNCQGFSSAGLRKGLKHDGSSLFSEVVRLAKTLKPPFMFLENVAAILGSSDIESIVASLNAAGYTLYWTVMRGYEVGSPQGRARWFCLCVRDGVSSWTLKLQQPFSRYPWKSEAVPRMVPRRPNTTHRRRIKQLGNSVIPDVVRAAFLSLFTGCTVPVPKLLALKSPGRVQFAAPTTLGPVERKGIGTSAYASVVKGRWKTIPKPPGLLPKPRLGMVLDPKAYKPAKDVRTQNTTSPVLTYPVALDVWATPRTNCGVGNSLTTRMSNDLGTQVRFEKSTPANTRAGTINPDWVEWLMGFPRGWTSVPLSK